MTDFPKQKNYIYKFVPFSTNTLKLLIKGEIYFGIPHNLNDPFEGEFTLEDFETYPDADFIKEIYDKSFELSPDKIEKRLTELREKPEIFIKDVSDYLKKLLKAEYGVSCFSKNPHNILMWSHYADAHRGICLVFDKDLLLESLNKIWFSIELSDINYMAELPKIKPVLSQDQIKFSSLDKIFVTKFDHWQNEEEVRLHFHFANKNARRFVPFDKKSLKGIILGENMNDDDQETLIHLIKNDKAYEIQWGETSKNIQQRNMQIEETFYAINLKLNLAIETTRSKLANAKKI
jgi:hypothetical protein